MAEWGGCVGRCPLALTTAHYWRLPVRAPLATTRSPGRHYSAFTWPLPLLPSQFHAGARAPAGGLVSGPARPQRRGAAAADAGVPGARCSSRRRRLSAGRRPRPCRGGRRRQAGDGVAAAAASCSQASGCPAAGSRARSCPNAAPQPARGSSCRCRGPAAPGRSCGAAATAGSCRAPDQVLQDNRVCRGGSGGDLTAALHAGAACAASEHHLQCKQLSFLTAAARPPAGCPCRWAPWESCWWSWTL
jgi:hypothetical protein